MPEIVRVLFTLFCTILFYGLIMAHIFNRHESVLKDRDKLQRLADEMGNRCFNATVWHDGEKFKRDYRGNKFFKRYAHKIARRASDEDVLSGNKVYDYAWNC